MTSVFFSRLASTLALWTIVLGTILSGHELGFFLIVSTMGMVGLWEFYRMLDHGKLPNFKITAMICGGILFAGSYLAYHYLGKPQSIDFEAIALVGFLITVFSRQIFKGLHEVEPLPTMAYTLFGLFYVPWLFNFMNKIIYITPRGADLVATGQYYVLYLMVVTKFSDMGAYVVGSLCGKHLFVPHISPKKTWEGVGGALLFSTLGSFGMLALIPHRLPLLNWGHAAILGVGLGFAAIIGDLAESIIKRGANVKDSGNFLPGIGGALDLIDSLLFTAPILYFYLRCVLIPLS